MKSIPVGIILLVGFFAGCTSSTPAENTKTKSEPFQCATGYQYKPKSLEPLAPNVETARRLSLPVRFNEGEMTLKRFADQVKKTNNVDFWFDWPALAEVGVTPKTSVSIKASHPDGDRALAAMLWYCSPNDNTIYPTYMIVDGLVVVGTNRSLVQKLPQVNWPRRENPERREHFNSAVRLKLDERIVLQGSFSFDQIITVVAEQTGITIQPDWRKMELVGIDRDSLVTIYYPNHTAGELLAEAIDQVSADLFVDDKAGLLIHQGEIHFSTIGDLYRNRVTTETYNIDDLLISPYGPALQAIYEDDPFALKMLANHNLAWQVRWLDSDHRLWGRQTLTKEEIEGISRFDREHTVSEIQMLIEHRSTTEYERDRWLDDDWRITDLDGMISVRTIESVHRDIEQLMDQLRETRRLTLLRFMREIEATRLLKQARAVKRLGDLDAAIELLHRAKRIDPGNELVEVMLELIEATRP